jgi:ATP-dependent helicase HrpB
MFPVETIHVAPEATFSNSPVEACAMSVSHVIRQAYQTQEGDILAFLPGEVEIRRCAELLGTASGSTRIYPLYGMLPSKEQQQAIAPSKVGERKVVLATSIAETSLTIEGVRVVVDSGLCRKMVFDSQTGLSHLETVQISKDMADQRRGRAGRLAPGICYRLWTLATEHRMADCRVPEIEEADLAPMVLDIAAWGGCNVKELQWITPPPSSHVDQGIRLLKQLNALDDESKPSKARPLFNFSKYRNIAAVFLGILLFTGISYAAIQLFNVFRQTKTSEEILKLSKRNPYFQLCPPRIR